MKTAFLPVQSPRWYSTTEVAAILDTDEWRVKNFGLKTYGLEASVKAKGPGTRRRYYFNVLLRIAVANELYSAHISPAGIKAALQELEDSKAIEKWSSSYDTEGNPSALILTLDIEADKGQKQKGKDRFTRVWRVLDESKAMDSHTYFIECGSVVVSVNLVVLWESVVQRITDLEAAGEI